MFRCLRWNMPRKFLSISFTPVCAKSLSSGPSSSNLNYYEILGVKNTASASDIREAFVNLSKKYHPDLNKDDVNAHQRFVEINEAYSVLSKIDSRREYDRKIQHGGWSTNGRERPYYDPVQQRYRQYYDELERQRRRARRERPVDPYQDFWQDFGKRSDDRQEWTQRPPVQKQAKLDEQANRAFFLFIMTLATVALIVHMLQYSLIRQRMGPHEYGDIDQKLEQNWKNIVIVDRPDDEHGTSSQSPTTSSPAHRDDRFVEA